jgi:hypothetical protein
MTINPEQRRANERIEELLRELADIIGPSVEDDVGVEGKVLLAEWVLVSSWIDESGYAWVLTQTPENLPAHHRVGLLHTSLDT